MKFIPEYQPVKKLCLSFVHAFFNTRFKYGRTLCEIIRSVLHEVDIEVWVSRSDLPFFRTVCDEYHVNPDTITLNHDSPGRSVIAEYTPIFTQNAEGESVGLIFRHPFLNRAAELMEFSRRLTERSGFKVKEFSFEFVTAHLLVNEDLVFLSDCLFGDQDREAKLAFFTGNFPSHSFHVVPSLAGDITKDLDMYLWPIAPETWIVSEYPAHTPQAESIAPALNILKTRGHTVYRVPGLPPVQYDDINTLPNDTNGVIVNGTALCPAYPCREDNIVQDILLDCGYQVAPIDCSDIILSNSGVHCITKTLPDL